jgi:hypothetical protein
MVESLLGLAQRFAFGDRFHRSQGERREEREGTARPGHVRCDRFVARVRQDRCNRPFFAHLKLCPFTFTALSPEPAQKRRSYARP